MMSNIVINIFLLSIGASFVQRTTGFGFGIFIMTMLPFFLPTYGEATTLSGLLAITTSAVRRTRKTSPIIAFQQANTTSTVVPPC